MAIGKAAWMAVALGGLALASGVIYTFFGFTGQVVEEALSNPGRPPVSRPPPEIPKVAVPDGGPLKQLVQRYQGGAAQTHGGPVAHALREHDGPLLRAARQRLGSFSAPDAEAMARATESVSLADIGAVNLDDPSGRDLQYLLKVVREGSAEQQLSAARAMVEIGHPAFARSILSASEGAANAEPFCLAAMALIGDQSSEAVQAQLTALLSDAQLTMDPTCRAELSQAQSH